MIDEFNNMIALFDETNSNDSKIKYIINTNDISFIDFKNKKIFMSTKGNSNFSANTSSRCGQTDISGKLNNELVTIDISFLSDSQILSLVNALASSKQI